MEYESIDRALGRLGQRPQPLATTLTTKERDARLTNALWFPDRRLPVGELAEWAIVLIELGKEPSVMVAVAVVEAALSVIPRNRADVEFVEKVLVELHIWLKSSKGTKDLRRLGDLWWSLTRNPPQAAQTPLGEAAVLAWLVAGYDPEGWGDPPEEPEKLLNWTAEAANNVTAIVDVFSSAQEAVGADRYDVLRNAVRKTIESWRDMGSTTS